MKIYDRLFVAVLSKTPQSARVPDVTDVSPWCLW